MQSRNRSIDRSQPSFTRSLSKRLTQSMDRGLASQTMPNDATPGSVQSAAFNHFNRMKPHMSISNLQQQQQQQNQQQHQNQQQSNLNYDLRELSQEDLDGADYDVNDNNANQIIMNTNPVISPRRSQQQQQQQDDAATPIATSSGGGGGFRTGAVNLQPKTNPNFSNRSTTFNQNQFNPNNNNNNNNARRIPFENVNQQQQQDFDQLDEYYTVRVYFN